MKRQSGIYQIQSISNPQRIYIGSAINITQRWKQHISYLKKGIHHTIKLQRHFNKYGAEDLVFNILESCLPMGLLAREQEYLDKLKPYFNTCKIAGNTLGVKASEETRKKLSTKLMGNKRTLGFKHSEETKAKYKLRRYSKETKAKMSLALQGNQRRKDILHDIETKNKIGEASKKAWAEKKLKGGKLGHDPWTKGTHLSPEVKKNISEAIKKAFKERNYVSWNKGIPHSIETRKRISDARKGGTPWNKGRPWSLLEREKISKAKRQRSLFRKQKLAS